MIRNKLHCPACGDDKLGTPSPGKCATRADGDAGFRCTQCEFVFHVAVTQLRKSDMYVPIWAQRKPRGVRVVVMGRNS